MMKTSRREFLKKSGKGVAGASALNWMTWTASAAVKREHSIPAHRPLPLTGVHAYADGHSVPAGEIIQFHVSSTVPYQLSVCRLGLRVDDPLSDEILHTFPESPAAVQPIYPGSYVMVAKGLPELMSALTLECWVRLWKVDRFQSLITQQAAPSSCGVGLFITEKGEAAFYLGDGGMFRTEGLHSGAKLQPRKWHYVVGVWDGRTKSIWVDSERVGTWSWNGQVKPGDCALQLGASGEKGRADHFLDGDLAMPAIYGRALGDEEIKKRFEEKGSVVARGPAVLACWPLREERRERVADVSGHRRHGRIINHGTWMIGGPAFDGHKVPRYREYDPAKDATRGHGLRLASDDLYDCRWRVTHKYRLPKNAKSGIYVGRIRFEANGKPHLYQVTFIVRKARARAEAPILVLCSSNTWLAYSATPFAVNAPPGQFWGTNGLQNSDPQAPAYCCYRNHHGGQPAYQVGLRLPWPVAGPDVLYSAPAVGYSHLMRGERFLHHWLEEAGYEFDVITDVDLHRDPAQLRGYKTLIINGHSEYWSIEAYEGLDRYLRQGGTAIVLSGNTMFWRVTFNDDASVMECRKFDERIGGRGGASIGELYHSHDGNRGSLMRECGYPAWKVVGLECCGWADIKAKEFGVYQTADPNHFLFRQPEVVGLAMGETFGHAPGGGVPKAIGHEWDVRVSTLNKMTTKIPPGGVLPEEPPGIVTLAPGVRQGGGTLDYFTASTRSIDGVCAEMIYWPRPQGGRVFNAGAIGAGWALSADPKLQALLRNVLHHFGVSRR